jgi:hypothetical protein
VVARRDVERILDVRQGLVVIAAATRHHRLLQRQETMGGHLVDALEQPGCSLVPALGGRDLQLVAVFRSESESGHRGFLHVPLVAVACVRALRVFD